MKRKDGFEIRTEDDKDWGPTVTIDDPMAPTHLPTEVCTDIPANAHNVSEWQHGINNNRPYYDSLNDEYWARVRLFDSNGKMLPESEQIHAAPYSGKEAKERGWL